MHLLRAPVRNTQLLSTRIAASYISVVKAPRACTHSHTSPRVFAEASFLTRGFARRVRYGTHRAGEPLCSLSWIKDSRGLTAVLTRSVTMTRQKRAVASGTADVQDTEEVTSTALARAEHCRVSVFVG
eukprot:1177167-Prorocentrum_minimum.AAC.12